MKEYTKPAMMALSISANDMLCGCGQPLKGTDFGTIMLQWHDKNEDGRLDDGDFAPGTFGAEVECTVQPEDFAVYCKYSASADPIFWS